MLTKSAFADLCSKISAAGVNLPPRKLPLLGDAVKIAMYHRKERLHDIADYLRDQELRDDILAAADFPLPVNTTPQDVALDQVRCSLAAESIGKTTPLHIVTLKAVQSGKIRRLPHTVLCNGAFPDMVLVTTHEGILRGGKVKHEVMCRKCIETYGKVRERYNG